MSFSGDLEHLPIVDVIQLVYSTKKSGTLSIKSPKGESHLVFSDGYFVSANHLDNSIRIGQILVDNNLLTRNLLEQALLEQNNAGEGRKPLIATLIENGFISPLDAYKSLESLIEMTIVEVLTWTSGTFSLDVGTSELSDEYRYFPETLKQEILMNAQGILMDALRIYDEKLRDGSLEQVFLLEVTGKQETPASPDNSQSITADLLGLDVLDTLSKKIPDVFIGLKDEDASAEHSRVIAEELGDLPPEGRDKLCSLLTQFSAATPEQGGGHPGALPLAVIVFSSDRFITHAIATLCRQKNHAIFTTDDDANLDLFIEQSLTHDLLPLLIMDAPAFIGKGYTAEGLAKQLQQKRERYPRISILQMSSSPNEIHTFPPHVLDEGTEIVLTRPVLGSCAETFAEHMTSFLKSFSSVLEKSFRQIDRQNARNLKESVTRLASMTETPEVARELLHYTSVLFERAMILVVGATELTADKGIGLTAEKSAGLTGPLMFKIPLGEDSVFKDVLRNRQVYYGLSTDASLKAHLYTAVPAPRSPKILILPLLLSGDVIALIYADFGQAAPALIQVEYLEILSRFAGLVLDCSFNRKKLERLTRAN
jgi:hypothetical protein